ncbi:TadE/TadG family type IV pilus assembly protein [Intrasporangium flavum]|uniref:TadE/TadG family type IV pilus assembly protein n=1 Tax=Intrasporangium flavum TaxID=1428657 RepID=UPI001F617B61|nr:TadE family protein [Intrasporangium flavum]
MEFAIVLPVLLLVLGGIVDFGRYFFVQIQVTNASREGVRAAVMYPNPAAADMTAITARAMAAAGAAPGIAVQGVSTCAASATTNASVTVTAPFNWIILGPAIRMVGGNWSRLNGPVAATGVMRCGG